MAAQLLEEAGSTEAAGQDDDADSETPHVRQKDIESSDNGDKFDEWVLPKMDRHIRSLLGKSIVAQCCAHKKKLLPREQKLEQVVNQSLYFTKVTIFNEVVRDVHIA